MKTLRGWAAGLACLLPVLAVAQPAAPQNALNFAGGDDRVVVSTLPSFVDDLSRDFTVTFWVRRDAAVTARAFYAQRDVQNLATVLLSPESVVFYVRRAGTTYSVSAPASTSGAWFHVAARWDGDTNTAELLVDGVPAAIVPGGATSSGIDGLMTIGARIDGAQALVGALDDFALWNTWRTTAQIRAERASTCVPTAGLVLKYTFDVGTPGGDNAGIVTVPDAASGAVPATLVNFALAGPTSNWVAAGRSPTAPAIVFDPPVTTIATSEDGTTYTGGVRLAVPPVENVTVTLATNTPGEAVVAPATLEFTPGNADQAQAFTVTAVDDGLLDGAGAFTLTASSESIETCQDGLVATRAGLNADDDSGRVDLAGAAQAEGNAGTADVLLPVTYTGAPAPAFTVPYSTEDGSALAGVDYVATTGVLSFTGTPGQTVWARVPMLGNLESQPDRSFGVRLGVPGNAGVSVGTAVAAAAIVDDDLDVQVSLDDGVMSVEPGQVVAYGLVVKNASPTLDAGAVPVSFAAIPLEAVSWTCTGSGGASCAGGSGEFDAVATLPPGSQASYVVTGTVGAADEGATAALVAVASAAVPSDSRPGNNVAVDVDGGGLVFADGFE